MRQLHGAGTGAIATATLGYPCTISESGSGPSWSDAVAVAGDVEELPEGTKEYNPVIMRIRPSGQQPQEAEHATQRQAGEASTSTPGHATGPASPEGTSRDSLL